MDANRKFRMPTPEENAEITAAALSDPDAQPLTDEQLAAMVPLKPGRGRPRSEAPKEPINIRMPPDVLEAFRTTGAGWQTRIDGALRDWLRTHSQAQQKTRPKVVACDAWDPTLRAPIRRFFVEGSTRSRG